ncbi:MAG: FkbM family methyltransferase [Bryobacterales bacterium]|nr:FkbM family methyltransferase [Bryobacterales bacterium]
MISLLWDRMLCAAGAATVSALVNNHRIRVPRQLRRSVGISLADRPGLYFETPAMIGLEAVLEAGDTAFDVGCSYGVFTCLMSRMVGPAGAIYSFDANQDVLAWTRRVVTLNGLDATSRLIHACVGESTAGSVDFFHVPGAHSVASTRNPEIRAFHAAAVPLAVPLLSLDEFCENLPAQPRCLKIDVEGSECLVLRGAARLLAAERPHLVLETHGLEVDGIGGSVAEVCRMLEALGYPLLDLASGEPVDSAGYARRYARQIGYLLASSKINDPDTVRRIRRCYLP